MSPCVISYLLQNNIQMHFWATAISGTVLFRELSPACRIRSRQRAPATAAPFLPALIICLAIGGIRQQQLSPHGLFQEFKVIGGENAIVLYPVIKKKIKKKKKAKAVDFKPPFRLDEKKNKLVLAPNCADNTLPVSLSSSRLSSEFFNNSH